MVFFSTCDSVDYHALLFRETEWPQDLDAAIEGQPGEIENVSAERRGKAKYFYCFSVGCFPPTCLHIIFYYHCVNELNHFFAIISIHLFIYFFIHIILSIFYSFTSTFIYLFIHFLFVDLFIYLFVYLFIYLYVYLFIYLFNY